MVKVYSIKDGKLTSFDSLNCIEKESWSKDEKRELWAQFSDGEKSDIAEICKVFNGKLG